jgi:hypothetical protein
MEFKNRSDNSKLCENSNHHKIIHKMPGHHTRKALRRGPTEKSHWALHTHTHTLRKVLM